MRASAESSASIDKAFKVTPERVKALLEPDDWDATEASLGERVQRACSRGRISCSPAQRRTALVLGDRGGHRRCRMAGITRISGVTMDITERKRAEERQAFLAREVDHRARNVLAVVQSMLRLTRAETTEAYVAAVEGRINALSRAHMLLSECRWEGADLRRLVDEELEPVSQR